MHRRRILFLTGTRADFGKLKPLIQRVDAAPDLECSLFVTGMHTLAKYGYTLDEVYKTFGEKRLTDGFRSVHTFINQVEGESMERILAETITGLSRYVAELRPDMLVVHGDRVEALAGAIVGALRNIRVAHVEGGELSGTVDEIMRHAVSKMSHNHFAANKEARGRLMQMGESAESIYVIGSPDIDVMLSDGLPPLAEVKRHYGIDFDKYAVFCYHPVTTELSELPEQIEEVLLGLQASGLNFVVTYPNNDAGSDIIRRTEDRVLRDDPRFALFPSLRFECFLTLLKHASVIVGNSSAGVREAPVYGVPAINIGSRQNGRVRHASVTDTVPERAAVAAALTELQDCDRLPAAHLFGNGSSAERFMEALRSDAFWSVPIQKRFVDQEV